MKMKIIEIAVFVLTSVFLLSCQNKKEKWNGDISISQDKSLVENRSKIRVEREKQADEIYVHLFRYVFQEEFERNKNSCDVVFHAKFDAEISNVEEVFDKYPCIIQGPNGFKNNEALLIRVYKIESFEKNKSLVFVSATYGVLAANIYIFLVTWVDDKYILEMKGMAFS